MPALTRFVLGHKLLVVVAWLVLATAGVLTAAGTTHRLTNDFSMPGQGYRVDNRIVAEYGNGGSQTPYVAVLTAPAGEQVSGPAATAQSGRAFAALRQVLPGARIADYATTGDRAFLTSDGRSTFALVFVAPVTPFGAPDPGPDLRRALSAGAPAGWRAGITGMQELAQGASAKGTSVLAEAMIGSAGALVVLAVLFASFLALLPLLVGGVSVLTTFLLIGGLTEVTGVSQIVEYLVALIGLGVAIDYSLLVVSRWREERAGGLDNTAAVVAAMSHAGRAVVFSGLTVAIGLLAMIVLPVPMLRSVGIGGVLVPLVSVAVATTLLPVVLATAGPRLDWPRLRTERSASRVFSAWARGVYAQRWLAAIGGVVILAVLALPALSLHLGEPGSSSQATAGPAHAALTTLTRGGVPSGVLTPAEVLTSARPGAIAAAERAARAVPGVHTVVAPATADYRHDGTAIVTVLPSAESSLPSGQATIARLESALLAHGGVPGVVGVGGDGASVADFDHAVYGAFPLMLALVAVATFLLLTRALRSVLLAVKAVACNLISLAAAYGVLTWVWQDGHGSGAIWGIPATGAITMWVPLMVFAFLFGLSMDYEVFILTRIREAYDASGDARRAVTEGLGRTGRLVTGAAAILMFSFLSMSTAPMTDLKVLATGLGAGILVDAAIVRCLLVPALVALFGRANWWLPGPLARLLLLAAAPGAGRDDRPYATPALAGSAASDPSRPAASAGR